MTHHRKPHVRPHPIRLGNHRLPVCPVCSLEVPNGQERRRGGESYHKSPCFGLAKRAG